MIDTTDPNLVTEAVVLTWGDMERHAHQTFTIPGPATTALASFKAFQEGACI